MDKLVTVWWWKLPVKFKGQGHKNLTKEDSGHLSLTRDHKLWDSWTVFPLKLAGQRWVIAGSEALILQGWFSAKKAEVGGIMLEM